MVLGSCLNNSKKIVKKPQSTSIYNKKEKVVNNAAENFAGN